MNSILALLAVAFLQDTDALYREALYQEVDRGDLDRAAGIYQKIEADVSAQEEVRARALFRLAWCHEKKGSRPDAEHAYRDVTTKYSAQSEIAKKAKDRLERLLSGNGVTSTGERIEEMILALGIEGPDHDTTGHSRNQAFRTLLLIGEPAVPALLKAMEHKDPLLSSMAACVLVALEEDAGTYPRLMNGLRSAYYSRDDCARHLGILFQRQKDLRKDFIDTFLKESDAGILNLLLQVLRYHPIPELRDRLKEMIVHSSEPLSENALSCLLPMEEADLLDLLQMCKDVTDGAQRADGLLIQVSSSDQPPKVSDTTTFCRRLLDLFPTGNPWPERIGKPVISRFVPYQTILENCAETWLRQGSEQAMGWLSSRISHGLLPTENSTKVNKANILLACRLLDANPEFRRTVPEIFDRLCLLGALLPDPVALKRRQSVNSFEIPDFTSFPIDENTRATLEKTLWDGVEDKEEDIQRKALWGVYSLLSEEHPRWEEWIRRTLSEISKEGREMQVLGNTEYLSIEELFGSFTEEGKKRCRKIVSETMTSNNVALQRLAIQMIGSIGDESRVETLSRLLLDATQPEELRLAALQGMQNIPAEKDGNDVKEDAFVRLATDGKQSITIRIAAFGLSNGSERFYSTLLTLSGDPDSKMRSLAVNVLKNSRNPQIDAEMARLLNDTVVSIQSTALHYFCALPTRETIPLLAKALESPREDFRGDATEAIAQTGAKEAIPHLIRMLEDPVESIRTTALTGLEKIRKHFDEIEKWKEWNEKVNPKKD